MDVLTIVIITLVTSAVAGYAASKIASKVVRKRGEKIIKEAEAEGEMIKKERILQAKEKFIQLKSEHDRAVNERKRREWRRASSAPSRSKAACSPSKRSFREKPRRSTPAHERSYAPLQGVERRKEELRPQDQRARKPSGFEQIGGLGRRGKRRTS